MKSTSCELDTIPTNILKILLPGVAELITKIINTSLGKGIFCRQWKTAIVHPLHKKLDLHLILANFRPVSNLTFISKVVECAMLLQISKHCKEFNLQPDYQSAYQENYSCKTAVLRISIDVVCTMERKSIMSLVAIDLSATFHTVNHNILFQMLTNKFGIEDTALKWFDSYLCPQSFKVTVGNKHSQEKRLNCKHPTRIMYQCGNLQPLLHTLPRCG